MKNSTKLTFYMINDNLEKQAQAIFKSWFVDFEPFQDGEFVDSELGMIPKGWNISSLDKCIEFDPREKNEKNKEFRFFDMKSLSTDGMLINEGVRRVISSASCFRNGDTLLAKITPCLENGKTGFVMGLKNGELAKGSTEFIVMRTKGSVSPYWIYCLARNADFRNVAIKSMIGSSGRQRVQLNVLKNYPIVFSQKLMNDYHSLVKPFFMKILENKQQIWALTQLRDSLLPKLMSGELSVGDI